MNKWNKILMNQKTQLEKILYIHQVNQDLIKVMDMIKVLTQWQFRTMNMYKRLRNLQKNHDNKTI